VEESKIFTAAELKALKNRLSGSKKDYTGIYSARVKPKIKELLEWFKIKNKLKKLL
jgi:hypothetical protein